VSSDLQLFGSRQLKRALKELGEDAAKQVMRKAIGKALLPARRQAKQNVKKHKRSGALQKAIWSKAGGKKKSTKAWGKIFVRSKPQEWNGKKINPVKYAHLIEFGTRKAPADPFMRMAMSQKRGEINHLLFVEGWKSMEDFAVRMRKKHNTMWAKRQAKLVAASRL
jgi:HK97 gp10 family phage protein